MTDRRLGQPPPGPRHCARRCTQLPQMSWNDWHALAVATVAVKLFISVTEGGDGVRFHAFLLMRPWLWPWPDHLAHTWPLWWCDLPNALRRDRQTHATESITTQHLGVIKNDSLLRFAADKCHCIVWLLYVDVDVHVVVAWQLASGREPQWRAVVGHTTAESLQCSMLTSVVRKPRRSLA